MDNTNLKAIGFDQIAGGTVVSAATMALLIANANVTDQNALATEIAAILQDDPTPGNVVTDQLQIDSGTKTAAATAGAATLNKNSGKITSEALTTAAGAQYTLTLTDSQIAAADVVVASVAQGTSTAGTPCVTTVKPAAGGATIVVQNVHATDALNGTIVISFAVFKNVADQPS